MLSLTRVFLKIINLSSFNDRDWLIIGSIYIDTYTNLPYDIYFIILPILFSYTHFTHLPLYIKKIKNYLLNVRV